MNTRVVDPQTSAWEEASTHRTPGIDIKQLLQRDGEGRSFEFNVVRFGGRTSGARATATTSTRSGSASRA
ncbi:hypothetical protein [Nocardioides humi]|uniref:hypothetical protein n=1 Tax=Nocardioides humi TaxID=449461 RepID=UPI00112903A1|nr:hypothetical protein [Nocardioides humi]